VIEVGERRTWKEGKKGKVATTIYFLLGVIKSMKVLVHSSFEDRRLSRLNSG
jgi:hypothetical protein